MDAMTQPAVLLSQRVINEFGPRVHDILARAPRPLTVLPFTRDTQLASCEAAHIEAAYYSRDVWEGTEKSVLSPAAQAFWRIIGDAPNLKWMAVYSAGMDQQRYVDALKRGVRLTSSAGAQSESVGLACVSCLLALARGVTYWHAKQQQANWSPLRGKDVPPDLPGQRVVIVGTGYIGKVIALVLRAVGMHITGVRRAPGTEEHFDEIKPPAALDSLLAQCDWLVVACPLTSETRNLIDARRLALMKPSAGIANIARGEIIDEAALIDALRGGRLKHAYLDVFHTEPLPAASPLWTLPNVLISPHNAGASAGTYARGVEIFLRNLENYLSGRALVNEATLET
jgi:phosphoglycerate dehydrogenase-like enzyme